MGKKQTDAETDVNAEPVKQESKKKTSESKPAKREVPKPVYTAAEFTKAARKLFGENVSPDCVTAALRTAGLEQATIEQAKEAVNKFMNKEVK